MRFCIKFLKIQKSLNQSKIQSMAIKDLYFSVEFHKELFTISTEDTFEQQLKNFFIQELESAEKISKNDVARSFKIVVNSVKLNKNPTNYFYYQNIKN